jgi:hypothetical protein
MSVLRPRRTPLSQIAYCLLIAAAVTSLAGEASAAQDPVLSLFPQLPQTTISQPLSAVTLAPSIMAAKQSSPLNNKLVPYDAAKTELKQRDALMPAPTDVETIIPTKNSALFRGGAK